MHKPCAEPGCVTLAVFNQPGAGHGLYCGQHKPIGYVNVKVSLRSPSHRLAPRYPRAYQDLQFCALRSVFSSGRLLQVSAC